MYHDLTVSQVAYPFHLIYFVDKFTAEIDSRYLLSAINQQQNLNTPKLGDFLLCSGLSEKLTLKKVNCLENLTAF